MKLVSVIVRSTNRQVLGEAIQSIENQTYKNVEIIIVDATGTGEINDKNFNTTRNINIICTGEQLNRPKAANIGISSAKGDELIFLDEDDIFYEQHISKLIDARKKNPENLAAYSDVEVIGSNQERILVYDNEWSRSKLYLSNYIPINSVLFSNEILNFGCTFDDSLLLLEDWDWWLQVANHTSFTHVEGISACYRYGLGESNHSEMYKKWRFSVCKKWMNISGIEEIIDHSFDWAEQLDSITHEKFLLTNEVAQRDEYIDILRLQISAMEASHNSMITSRSWRITKPLRSLNRLIRSAHKITHKFSIMRLKRVIQLARQGQFISLYHKINRIISDNQDNEYNNHYDVTEKNIEWSKLSSLILRNEQQFIAHHDVTIIVPVYNAFEYLQAFFDSLLMNTTSPYTLLVIDDASPDKRVAPFLAEQLKRFSSMLLLTNSSNQGFVKTVNTGMKQAKGNIILLNTDTIVPSLWLERLLYPLNNKEIASVTPFTNAGTICSFPATLKDNAPIYGLSVDAIDAVFKHIFIQPLEIPTAVGFCMAISRNALDQVGYFDAETFGRGYGEENDWCMRANQLGYHHVLCTNLYVHHAHGGSFLPEDKQELLASNLKIIEQRYPNYGNLVQSYIQIDPSKFYRESARILLMLRNENKPVLVIDHDRGGGANHYRYRAVQKWLKEGRTVCVYIEDYLTGLRQMRCYKGEDYIYIHMKDNHDLIDFLQKTRFEEVHYNSLVFSLDPISNVDIISDIKEPTSLTINVHDFFPVCPSYTLLNYQDEYCGIPDIAHCRSCIKKHCDIYPNAKKDIDIWRSHWQHLLQRSEIIRCFSESSAQLIERAYPEIKNKIITIPHDTNYFKPELNLPSLENDLHIGIIGSINKQKGAKIIQDFSNYIKNNNIPCKITLIGEIDTNYKLPSIVNVTGEYSHDDLPRIIEEYGVQIIWFPAIWPETFSYVTSECIAMDLPITAFDIGAPAERLKKYHKSFIHRSKNPDRLYDDFLKFRIRLLSGSAN